MTPETKDIVLRALERLRGDDLERCEAKFRRCSPAEMAQYYGVAGQTRQQILDSHREARKKIDAAINEVKGMTR